MTNPLGPTMHDANNELSDPTAPRTTPPTATHGSVQVDQARAILLDLLSRALERYHSDVPYDGARRAPQATMSPCFSGGGGLGSHSAGLLRR